MAATFIRPIPALTLPEDFISMPREDLNVIVPEFLASNDIVGSIVASPVHDETNYGIPLMKPQDCWWRAPVYASVYENGMVQVRPGGGPKEDEVGRMNINGTPTDSIITMPQFAETLLFTALGFASSRLALAGLITVRDSYQLYEPHNVAYVEMK